MLVTVGVLSLVTLACLSWWRYAFLALKLKYLFRGRDLIHELANLHQGSPICLPTFGFGGRMHIISARNHLNEISKATPHYLSEHLWAEEQVQSHLSLGVKWSKLEQREADGNPMNSAIRSGLNHYSELQPKYLNIIREELESAFVKGAMNQGYRMIPFCHTIERIIARLNTLLMLGEELANDPVFIERGLAYSGEAKVIAELVKVLPSFFAPAIAKLIKGLSGNEKYVVKVMTELIHQKRKEGTSATNSSKKIKTVLEALVDRAPGHWTMREFIRDINITWNTTNSASPILGIQLIHDICRHNSYLPSLLSEAQSFEPTTDLAKLPLLDAFMMESMRTQCFSSTRVHRMALKDFTFSNGYTVPAGESVQFNLRRMFQDEELYPEAETFNLERHLTKPISSTDVKAEWPFWGVPKLPCPGRFFAVNVAKLLAICLLEDWEFKIKDEKALNIVWRDFSVPNPRTKLSIKRIV